MILSNHTEYSISVENYIYWISLTINRDIELKKMQNIANQIRRKKAWKNKKRIYGIICKNSGLTNYKLSKKIGWTTGKVDYYLKHLLKDGLIKNETSIVNGRVHKTYFSKTVKEFINWDEMTNTKFG